MLWLIKSNILLIVLGLFALKYSIQFVFSLNKNKRTIISSCPPNIHSSIVFMVALPVFLIFIYKHSYLQCYVIGLVILTIGLLLGILGILSLNKNYHNDLVVYKMAPLLNTGILQYH